MDEHTVFSSYYSLIGFRNTNSNKQIKRDVMSNDNFPPEFYQANIAAESARKKASSDSGSASTDALNKIDELSKQLKQLSLLSESMWLLLQKTSGLKPEQLQLALTKVQENREQRSQARVKCPKCAQSISAKANKCIYCGAETRATLQKNPFEI
ncbi:zinc ribbon domain-containing protein [Aurantivibrio infirmus]